MRILTAASMLAFSASPAFAQTGAGGPFGSGFMAMVPWIAIFAIFYFLLIRPQQKQAKEHQKMLDNLQRGDRVLTQGGLYGTVAALKGKAVEVKLTEDVKVLVARSAITERVTADPAVETAEKVAK